ncbi:FG-GAP repeat domain-containing protein [Hyalangium versicolor]|uniref:FG-GAP repeat domain-containing protein n=1 Tax=Hyalangium versicolor TaxID=2861190 RepID=UPI001CC995E7|nr:VCBS repeat-containing protein [Hyalangium versicolor]
MKPFIPRRASAFVCLLILNTSIEALADISSGIIDWGHVTDRDWVDFNGDGRADYCRRVGGTNLQSSYVSCTVSTGTGFGSTSYSGVIDWGQEAGRAWVDFDGDGRADFCRWVGSSSDPSTYVSCTVSTGAGFGATYSSNFLDGGQEIGRAWVDFNGDGRADFCRWVGDSSSPFGSVSCTESTGTGFGDTYTSYVVDGGPETSRAWVDFNGDGRADFCRRVGNTSAQSGYVSCTVSTSAGFGRTYTSSVIDWGNEAGRAWVDFNGDGRADFCRVHGSIYQQSNYLSCTISLGTGFGGTYSSGVLDGGYDTGRAWVDFNGDGRADFCRHVGGAPSRYVACTASTGTGFGNLYSSSALDWGQDAGRDWVDFNGDGKADFCRLTGGTNFQSSYATCTLSP